VHEHAPGAAAEPDETATQTTGDAAVDAALTRLVELEALPVRAHVGVFDAVHGALQDRLADDGA